MKAGSAFLGTVIAMGVLGFGLDKVFETTPWGMMALIVIGFVGATMQAQKQVNKKD